MDSALPLGTGSAQRALLLTTLAAVPLTGWTLHAVALHRKLAAARRDPLTGLLGRDGYTVKARQSLSRYADTVVIMCDLDHFKSINDTLGHAVGDAVIAATADRLSTWAGSRAAVGRLGGDEFALTLRIAPERRQARLAHLVHKLAEPVVLEDDRVVQVAASIGAAPGDSLSTTNLSVLQRAADVALYKGKHTGRAVVAAPEDLTAASVNGRRAGRPGAHPLERTA
ncbi:GGDEF domain-containing protein [Streptomyces sp. NBC_01422]|uniref:GGDEF domain-containing protein n=1 Tax=Streptomyces sp. NBC_01422 TaxID=2903859 RepID=UPI002E286D87|nr:GGDEF domain-containing protein [Streptomyces sp. NBC_01422]